MGVDADRPRTDQAAKPVGASPEQAAPDVPGMLASAIAERYASEERQRRQQRTEAAIRRARETR